MQPEQTVVYENNLISILKRDFSVSPLLVHNCAVVSAYFAHFGSIVSTQGSRKNTNFRHAKIPCFT